MSGLPPDLKILQGHVVAFFAFDIGYEVDLDKISRLLPAQPIQPISRSKQNPTYIQYTKPPRTISLGESTRLPGMAGQIHATIFDFGSISISFRWPILPDFPLSDLPKLSRTIFECDLEQEAWMAVRQLMRQIEPAISRPCLSGLMEDYFVFIIEQTAPVLTGQEFLARFPSTLAGTLRFETETLSAEQERDALSRAISYYPHDLAIIDWNATVILDADYADTLSVLELLNVELLEARYIDAELDRRIDAYDDLAKQQSRWLLPFLNPYRQSMRDLAELRIEATLQAERVENALKLIGDLYLARVHKAVSERFYLGTWDEAISRKLDIIGNFYQLLADRVSTSQGQTLELIIILLILIDILLK